MKRGFGAVGRTLALPRMVARRTPTECKVKMVTFFICLAQRLSRAPTGPKRGAGDTVTDGSAAGAGEEPASQQGGGGGGVAGGSAADAAAVSSV